MRTVYLSLTAMALGLTLSLAHAGPAVPIKHFPTYPAPNLAHKSPADIALIKKGEYLAKAGDCIACHTQTTKHAKPFAGGLPFKTPFGTFYSPNITPDKETGIGNWTEKDFVHAMKEGVRPDGSNSYPVFPFVYFNKINKADLLAIKAYLMSLPPVHYTPPDNDIPFVLKWRFLQSGWRTLFFNFHKSEFKPDPNRSKTWNRGAYLVKGLEHCGMCHTPLNPLGAAKTAEFLGGGFVDGYYAPNITSETLKHHTLQEIIDVFKKGQKFNGAGQVGGPMAEVNRNSLQHLSDADLKAIAVYLKTVKPVVQQTKKITGANVGEQIYESNCAVCHNPGSAGAPRLGDLNAWEKRLAHPGGMGLLVKHAIHGLNSMPPMGTCMSCTHEQIEKTVQYIVKATREGVGSAPIIVTTPPRFNTGLKLGKDIYAAHCESCHAQHNLGIQNHSTWKQRAKKDPLMLFEHTRKGYGTMPAQSNLSRQEIIAAVKYILSQQSIPGKNYSLW